MISYRVSVTLYPICHSVSSPTAPQPPTPDPAEHRESFRCSCLIKYYDARLSGLDHLQAIREASRLLRLAEHPWHSFDVVAHEINLALGRRPGRPRSSRRGDQ